MANFKPRINLSVGGWRLVRKLGSGGNAEVWDAERDRERVALKMLVGEHTKESERYQRFAQEIKLLKILGTRPGVLPLLDSELPPHSDANTTARYAMPIAVSLRDHLGGYPTLEEIVTAILAFTRTVAGLHSENIYHRDLKPSNLFWRDGEFAIGDFGIASFPTKLDLTRPGRKLGPLHFHAPELLSTADTAAGGPVDVYSLAKTLWVLAAGQKYPPPGELRIDSPSLRVSSWFVHSRIRLLDITLERCTKHEPNSRPSMAGLAIELEAWSNPKGAATSMNDYSDLLNEIASLNETERRDRQLQQEKFSTLDQIREHILQRLKPLEEAYRKMNLTVVNTTDFEESTRDFALEKAPHPNDDVVYRREGVVQGGSNGFGVRSGISLRLTRSDEVILVGTHLFLGAGREVLWSKVLKFPFGTAQEENAIDEIVGGLTEHFGAVVIRIRDFLSESQQDSRL